MSHAERSVLSLTGGVLPPMVTPLRADRSLDLPSLDRLVDALFDAGVDGLVPLGSTGENGALTEPERAVVATRVIERAAGRGPVVIGIPPLSTRAAANEATARAAAGADAVLVSAPASTAYSDRELYEHFATVAGAIDIPLMAYEVPGRVHVSLGVELVTRLARDGVARAFKDSSGNLPRARRIAVETADVDGFVRYTGAEEAVDAALLGGFDGCIPGLANVVPWLHVALVRHARAGDWDAAARVQGELVAVSRLYEAPRAGSSFTAQAVGALKAALVGRGVIDDDALVPPLQGPDDAQRAAVATVMADVPAPRVEGAPT